MYEGMNVSMYVCLYVCLGVLFSKYDERDSISTAQFSPACSLLLGPLWMPVPVTAQSCALWWYFHHNKLRVLPSIHLPLSLNQNEVLPRAHLPKFLTKLGSFLLKNPLFCEQRPKLLAKFLGRSLDNLCSWRTLSVPTSEHEHLASFIAVLAALQVLTPPTSSRFQKVSFLLAWFEGQLPCCCRL